MFYSRCSWIVQGSKTASPNDGHIDEDIAATTERGDELFDDLLEQLYDEDDPHGVAYSTWVSLTQLLATYGWTGAELARDATRHAEQQRTLDEAGGTA